jgi:hypothetical protein
MLGAIAGDDAVRRRVSARLQELVARLSATAQPQDGVTVAERIATASDDEIFGFIDNELGAGAEGNE